MLANSIAAHERRSIGQMTPDPMDYLTLAGGRIITPRCRATSKRTRQRCGAPAERGKAVCRFHGAGSTGPTTAKGKARVVAAHWRHGRRSAQYVAERHERFRFLVLAGRLIPLLNRLEREGRETVTGAELLATGLTAEQIAKLVGSI